MLNDSYETRGDTEDDILDLLRDEGGRLAPADIYDDLGITGGTGQHPIYRLHAAGWIGRPRHGLYEFRYDPREMSDEQLAALFISHAVELTDEEHVSEIIGTPEQ